MLRDEELLSSIESEQMMYAFNDLIEEFKACRTFLTEITLNISESEFFGYLTVSMNLTFQ